MAKLAAVNDALRGVQLRYFNPDRVKSDVAALLEDVPSLRPLAKPMRRPDGTSPTVLAVEGTFQTIYAGCTYHTPMAMYLLEGYPIQAPYVLLTPSPDMFITPMHKHVDQTGVVYLPYLSEWKERGSSLTLLVGVMSSIFSAEPPLRSRPPGAPALQQQPPPMHMTATSAAVPPTGITGAAQTTVRPMGAGSPYSATGGSTPATPSVPVPHISTPVPAIRTDKDIKDELIRLLTPKLQSQMQGLLTELKGSLDRSAQAKEQLERRHAKGTALVTSLEEQLAALQSYDAALTAKIEEGNKWAATVEGTMGGLKPEEVESLVAPVTPLQAQLMTAVAEDAAIQDCYGYLDRALTERKIDVPTMMKEVRSLARQQFEARYLARKIDRMLAENIDRRNQAAGVRAPSALMRTLSTAGAPGSGPQTLYPQQPAGAPGYPPRLPVPTSR